jgi:pimeloyl-ACP methyl ester carboxylesterase
VAGLSVPYIPVGELSSIDLWKQVHADRFFYQLYFQEPGVAEAELSGDNARSLRMIYYAASGDAPSDLFHEKTPDATLLEGLIDPDPFPSWMGDHDLRVYVDAFDAGGWTGPLNRYRAQGFDAAEIGPMPDPVVTQPAAFVAGERDGVRRFVPGHDLYADPGAVCDDFRGSTIIPGIGHWVQQEAPAATNAALDDFVRSL